jgi:hypothetical protein
MNRNSEVWAADAKRLYQVAQELLPQSPLVELRVPRRLADAAVAAWHREDATGEPAQETGEQQGIRHDAATLVLIGQSIEASGVADGDDVVFTLDAWLLDNALEAADRAGQLDQSDAPNV